MGNDASLPSLEPAGQRLTLQEDIYRQLRAQLMGGGFVPGQSFTVRSIAETVGTSPMPVREALRRLASDRAVEIMPNGTSRVRLLTPRQAAELMDVRLTLEGRAARQAAAAIDAAGIDRLEELAEANLRDLNGHDLAAAARSNQAFHFRLYQAAGNSELLIIVENLWVQMGPTLMEFMLKAAGEGSDLARLSVAHFDIVRALRAADGAGAEAALRRDLGSVRI